jgi:hypothetical protein
LDSVIGANFAATGCGQTFPQQLGLVAWFWSARMVHFFLPGGRKQEFGASFRTLSLSYFFPVEVDLTAISLCIGSFDEQIRRTPPDCRIA